METDRHLPIIHPAAPSEQEAQRAAAHVTSGRDSAEPGKAPAYGPHGIPLHAAGGGPALGEAPPAVYPILRAPGRPLDLGARAFMEGRFGQDFSGVRIHTDALAAASARAVDAHAYTVGDHIVFAEGRYAPGLPAGRRLLAHELAHVAQGGPLAVHRGDGQGTGPSVTMPSLTTLLFQYNGASLRVELPTTVTATLPIHLRVGLLTFTIRTDIPNNFSFTIALNTRTHVRIATSLGLNRSTGQGSAGLVVESTETRCSLPNPATVQSELETRANRLDRAIRNFVSPPQTQTPPASGEGVTLPPEIDRARELGTAIYELYDRAQRATRCVTVPRWSVGLGVQGQVLPPTSAPPLSGGSTPPPAWSVGATLTIPF